MIIIIVIGGGGSFFRLFSLKLRQFSRSPHGTQSSLGGISIFSRFSHVLPSFTLSLRIGCFETSSACFFSLLFYSLNILSRDMTGII